MFPTSTHPKILQAHRERLALIYVRQSTLTQVRYHTGSTTRQYDLAARASALGWSPDLIRVVDQDQAHSGATAIGRDGFQWLVAEVGLGHAGAVLSVEASRLARSCSDWYRLLELCALTHTLVIDEEGVYDPTDYNDRLLLGFKGAMSEAELHWLRQRMQGGTLAKAQQGQLRFPLPIGLVHDPRGQIVLDPDEQVQQAVRLIFTLFEQHGSAMAVLRHFSAEGLRFPRRCREPGRQGELLWEPLQHGRVLSILHNPLYAGAYVFGRRQQTRVHSTDGTAVKVQIRQRKRADWPIVLRDDHPGYLSWDQFLRNQARLDSNRTCRFDAQPGAVREGAALLQGIVMCGKCGRRMQVKYLADGVTPGYECNVAHLHLGVNRCQSVRGDGVDAAVAASFLEALQPAQLEVSLAALDHLEAHARDVERQWQLQVERVRYEADLARRRFMAVEPENRLVARTLERDWNAKLQEVDRLEREYAERPRSSLYPLSIEERQRIVALAQDVPALWQAPTTSQTERKQLLRFLIRDVTLTLTAETIDIGIRWQSGVLTQLAIPRPQRSCDKYRTDARIVERIRALAPSHCDRQIAELLNSEGWRTSRGARFTENKVNGIRYSRGIPTMCPSKALGSAVGQRGDGRYSTPAVAALLNVNRSTVAVWCRTGRLDAIRDTPQGSYWVRLTEETIAALRRPAGRRTHAQPDTTINRDDAA
jgi:DNA invertase Pin-like site-specific DNA recombinase